MNAAPKADVLCAPYRVIAAADSVDLRLEIGWPGIAIGRQLSGLPAAPAPSTALTAAVSDHTYDHWQIPPPRPSSDLPGGGEEVGGRPRAVVWALKTT